LAEVVAAHSADAKAEYSRSLVDKAGKAEVRMLVPMVLLILPVTVTFAVFPGLQALRFDF
jgi:tight adherence protein C